MLLMSNVSKIYPGGSAALQDVNIHIEPGEFVFVVGPSGAGKSTFIKMLFREVIPTTGSIFVNGIDILKLQDKELFSRTTVCCRTEQYMKMWHLQCRLLKRLTEKLNAG